MPVLPQYVHHLLQLGDPKPTPYICLVLHETFHPGCFRGIPAVKKLEQSN